MAALLEWFLNDFWGCFERFLSLYGVFGEFSVNLCGVCGGFSCVFLDFDGFLGFLWNGSERVDGGTGTRDRNVRRFWRVLKSHEILKPETKKPSVHGGFKS